MMQGVYMCVPQWHLASLHASKGSKRNTSHALAKGLTEAATVRSRVEVWVLNPDLAVAVDVGGCTGQIAYSAFSWLQEVTVMSFMNTSHHSYYQHCTAHTVCACAHAHGAGPFSVQKHVQSGVLWFSCVACFCTCSVCLCTQHSLC